MTVVLVIILICNFLLALLYINLLHEFVELRKFTTMLGIAFMIDHEEREREKHAETCEEL